MLQNNWKEIAFADQKSSTIRGKEKRRRDACNKIRAKILSYMPERSESESKRKREARGRIIKRMIHIAREAYNNFNIVQKEKFVQSKRNLLSNNNVNNKNKIVR